MNYEIQYKSLWSGGWASLGGTDEDLQYLKENVDRLRKNALKYHHVREYRIVKIEVVY